MREDEKRVILLTDALSDISPFRLYNNIYFVGGRDVSVHIIDTGEGLVMIDTGYPYMRERIENNMRSLGLMPESIRLIIHSHGHYDHTGCTGYFKSLSGAKTAISRIDNNIVNGMLNLSWADELGLERLDPFSCDVLIDDGDVISVGNTSIRCVAAPGHTAGTMALFFYSGDKICSMHGGVGTNSMEKAFLERYGLSEDCRDAFRQGLHRLADEHVDIVLGNHPDQNDTEGKLARLKNGDENAFVDPGEWKRFLLNCERRLDAMLSEETQA